MKKKGNSPKERENGGERDPAPSALIECIRSKDLAVEIDALDVVTTNDEGWCQEDAYEGGFVFVRIRPMGP